MFGLDDVLAAGVILDPFEGHREEAAGKFCYLWEIGAAAAQRGAGGKGLQLLAVTPGYTVLEATQEQGDLGGTGPVVHVCFVQDDEAPVHAGGAIEQGGVIGPQEQVFQHSVVCEQDVRRRGLYFLPALQFVLDVRFIGIVLLEVAKCLLSLMLGLTDVAAERDGRVTGQQSPQSLHLVVG